MSIQSQLREIIVGHCTWLESKIEEIGSSIGSECAAWEDDPSAIRRIYELTHQVTGTCGTMGFADVSSAAADLETHLKALLEPGMPSRGEAQWRRAVSLFEHLKCVASKISPEKSSLFSSDFAAIRRRA